MKEEDREMTDIRHLNSGNSEKGYGNGDGEGGEFGRLKKGWGFKTLGSG